MDVGGRMWGGGGLDGCGGWVDVGLGGCGGLDGCWGWVDVGVGWMWRVG